MVSIDFFPTVPSSCNHCTTFSNLLSRRHRRLCGQTQRSPPSMLQKRP
jgi:hypothetical protein